MFERSGQISFWIAYALLAIFVIHALDFTHDHPHAIFGTGTYAYLHGDSKKIFLFLLLACAIARLFQLGARFLRQGLYGTAACAPLPITQSFDVIRAAIGGGIIARRVYE